MDIGHGHGHGHERRNRYGSSKEIGALVLGWGGPFVGAQGAGSPGLTRRGRPWAHKGPTRRAHKGAHKGRHASGRENEPVGAQGGTAVGAQGADSTGRTRCGQHWAHKGRTRTHKALSWAPCGQVCFCEQPYGSVHERGVVSESLFSPREA